MKQLLQNETLRRLWATLGYWPPIRNFPFYKKQIRGRHGLEIGGPSAIFRARRRLPLYPVVTSLDGCNFSSSTLWEPSLSEGRTYKYQAGKPAGHQYIRDAVDLGPIGSESYEFVLSSHALEHIANPLKALIEWRRVLSPSGTLVLILPDPRRTFDHNRPISNFDHLHKDLEDDVGEDDLTHLEEIVRLHDLKMDPGDLSAEEFRARCLDNNQYRAMHHHVFNGALVCEVLRYLGMVVLSQDYAPRSHLITLAKSRG